MKPQYITNENGDRTEVILSIKKYGALLYSQFSSDLELSDETKAILDQRLKDYQLNKEYGKEWNVIKSGLLNRSL